MKFGAVFPQYEIPPDPASMKDYAQALETLGFDYLLAYEHVVGANPQREGGWTGRYSSQHSFHEPFILFSYLAALTQKLQFVTGIIILPQRQTVLVAKQAAQLDLMSNGRLRLGIGIGWNKVELEALGFEFANRARRIEEQVKLLRDLWQQELVTFHGEFHSVEDAGLNPLPVQRPIPIWFGGGTQDVVLKRMAHLGDGWIAHHTALAEGEKALARLHQFLSEAGRTPDSFGIDVRLDAKTLAQEQWGDYITGWHALGASHMCLNTLDAGFTSFDQHLKAAEKFKAIADQLQSKGR